MRLLSAMMRCAVACTLTTETTSTSDTSSPANACSNILEDKPMDYETWADRKRGEAFSIAIGKLTEGEYDEHAISEGMQAESDVMRALHAHGLLP